MNIADSLYKSFAKAETGGVSDPWIRTYGVPGSSSTAYGPVQITATLAKDYLDRFSSLFDEEEKKYLKKFLDQGKKFIKYGREEGKEGYDPRYDYGGSGDLVGDEDKALYERVAKKMLIQHYRNNKGNLSDTIKEWRFGAASNKGQKDDERYWREVENTFVSQPDEPVEAAGSETPTDSADPSGTPSPSSIDPVGFLDNLMLLMQERLKGASQPSQEPTEAITEPEVPTTSFAEQIKDGVLSKREAAEKFLKRTANEAKLEAEAGGRKEPPKGFAETLRSSPKAREVLKEKFYNRPTYTAEIKEEVSEGVQDATKDPTYGIF